MGGERGHYDSFTAEYDTHDWMRGTRRYYHTPNESPGEKSTGATERSRSRSGNRNSDSHGEYNVQAGGNLNVPFSQYTSMPLHQPYPHEKMNEVCKEDESVWEEKYQEDAFTSAFLRVREKMTLQKVVKEVRSLMHTCRLPPMDIAAIEKYIIAVVERGRPLAGTQATREEKPPLQSQSPAERTPTRGEGAPGRGEDYRRRLTTSHILRPTSSSLLARRESESSRQRTLGARFTRVRTGTVPTTRTVKNAEYEYKEDRGSNSSDNNDTANNPPFAALYPDCKLHSVGLFNTYSRHAAWYASAYKDIFDEIKADEHNKQFRSLNTDREVMVSTLRYHDGHRNMRRLSNGHARKVLRRGNATQVMDEYDNGSFEGVSTELPYDETLADMMELRRILREHEAATFVVLAAIDRREAIMSKLRSLLAVAAVNMGLTVVSGHDDKRENSNSHDNSHAITDTNGVATATATITTSSSFLLHPITEVTLPSSVSQNVSSHNRLREAWSELTTPVNVPQPCTLRSSGTLDAPLRLNVQMKRRLYYRNGILYLFQQLQWASAAVVESVVAWRTLLSGNYPFVVNGRNYLLEMAKEVSNLAEDPVLRALFPTSNRGAPCMTEEEDEKKVDHNDGYNNNNNNNNSMDSITDPVVREKPAFPASLQYYPLLTNMPQLWEKRKPPEPPKLRRSNERRGEGLVHLNFFEKNNAHVMDGFFFDAYGHDAILNGSDDTHTDNNKNENYNGVKHVNPGNLLTYRRGNDTLTPAPRRPHSQSTKGVPQYVLDNRRLWDAEMIIHHEVAAQMKLLRRNFSACATGRYPLLLRGVGCLCGCRDGAVRLKSLQLRRRWYWQLYDALCCLGEGNSEVWRD